MLYVALVTLLILLQYYYFMMMVGGARGKGDVQAPAMSGDEYFDRCNRVHLNTLEQLIVALPAMWLCATYFRADVAAIAGLVFFIGRFLYSAAYKKDPSKRAPGFVMGFFANIVMMLCALYGVVMSLI